MDVGAVIKQARIAKGFTQEELAEKIGVKNAFVQESGTATDAYTPIFNNEGV